MKNEQKTSKKQSKRTVKLCLKTIKPEQKACVNGDSIGIKIGIDIDTKFFWEQCGQAFQDTYKRSNELEMEPKKC